MANEDVTTQDIMDFLKENMVLKSEFNERFLGLENRVGGLEDRVGGLEDRVGGLEDRVGHIENQMLTKDYLDKKLADLSAEFGGRLMRRAEKDKKFRGKIIEIFRSKNFPTEEALRELEELAK